MEGKDQPIAYWSKKFDKTESRYETVEQELYERLAAVMALRSLQRQQRDPQEKLTCLLAAVPHRLRICQETVSQNAMPRQGVNLVMVRRAHAQWLQLINSLAVPLFPEPVPDND